MTCGRLGSCSIEELKPVLELPLLQENFAVSRSSSINREIKMSRKMHFQLNREIKIHQNINDDEIFELERNFSDVFSNFTCELSFPVQYI